MICNPDLGLCLMALDNRLDLNQVKMDDKNKEIDFNLLSLYNTKLNIDALYLSSFPDFACLAEAAARRRVLQPALA